MPDPARRRRTDRGFTLIELMVVVLIIGVLLAIAIPTFLGARHRSQDAVARSSLRLGLEAASASSFESVDADGMSDIEPSLSYVKAGTESRGPKELSIAAGESGWAAAVLSESGTCFFVHTESGARPQWGQSASTCTADATSTIAGSDPSGGGGSGGSGGSDSSDPSPAPPIVAPGSGAYAKQVLATPGLVAYWSLDDARGTTAKDSGPNGYDGQYIGRPGLAQKPAVGSGTSASFTGGSYVSLPPMTIDWSSGITMAAWVRPTTSTFYQRVIDLSNGSNQGNIWLGRQESRKVLSYEVRAPDGVLQPVSGGEGSFGVGSWQFVVATESPDGTVTLYVNGKPVTTQGYSRYPTSETRTANYIGRPAWLSEPTFEGGIDEVTLFRRALSAEEVYKLAVTARDAAPKAAATRASSRAVKVGGA